MDGAPSSGRGTTTLSNVFNSLTEDQLKRIAATCLKYLGRKRKSSETDDIESLGDGYGSEGGRVFFNMGSSELNTQYDDQMESEKWDCAFDTPKEMSHLVKWHRISVRFCTEDTQPAPFVYTQMDVSASNVLVRDGKFVGFASDDRAGFFPHWWQSRALQLYRFFSEEMAVLERDWSRFNYPQTVEITEHGEFRGVDSASGDQGSNPGNSPEVAIDTRWADLLLDWFENVEESKHPFGLAVVSGLDVYPNLWY